MKGIFIVTCLIAGSLQGIQGVIWPCTTPADCPIAGTECSEYGACECAKGYMLSDDLSRCLKGARYGEECEEQIQCLFTPSGATCRGGSCVCNEGYQFIHGRCAQYSNLNEPCTTTSDCNFGFDRQSVTCTNRVCRCSAGYYERYTNVCRQRAIADGHCVVNEDCEGTGLPCVNFLCQNEPEGGEGKGIAIEEQATAKVKHSLRRSGLLQRASVGDRCTNYKQECADLPNSICSDGRCVCKTGFYEEEDQCFAELGETASDEDSCDHSFDAESGLCLCDANFFYEPGLRDCRKPIVTEQGRCVSDSQCSPFGAAYCGDERPRLCECHKYAVYDADAQKCIPTEGLGAYCEDSDECHLPNTFCSAENICDCKDSFVQSNGACTPGLGAECRFTEECSAQNSICDENVCRCANGYVRFGDECLKQAESVGDNCIQTIQCNAAMGDLAQCIGNKCSCSNESHLSNDVCREKRMLGDSCRTTSECYADAEQNLIQCRNSICQCQFGYVVDDATRMCKRQGKNSSSQMLALPVGVLTFMASAVLSNKFK